jgi:AraC-like DNA-binding protein
MISNVLVISLVKNFMHCIIRKNFTSKESSMIELTLLTLLNYVGDNFCEYRNLGHDNYKSLLLSYSDASNKFGPLEVKKVIEKSKNFKVTAVAIAAIKCPQHIVK